MHHIDENPFNHAIENLALLCLDCHNDTQIRGGFARKLGANDVIKYRDAWLARVEHRRKEVDRLMIERLSVLDDLPENSVQPIDSTEKWHPPSDKELLAHVRSLPHLLKSTYDLARPEWDSGVRLRMISGALLVIDVLSHVWVRLAAWYPPNHFGGIPASEYFKSLVESRQVWNSALGEPDGTGSAGRDAGIIAIGDTMLDIEDAVVETVEWLARSRLDDFDLEAWRTSWNEAKKGKLDF
jgi:hypothetical protein